MKKIKWLDKLYRKFVILGEKVNVNKQDRLVIASN